MKPHYSISIPKPCQEDWSKMTPNEKGRFCQSCSKTVVDFTKMNIEDIQTFIHHNKEKRICGHIKQSQLNSINLKIPETVFNQTLSFHRLFLLALLLAMGSTLFNCSDNTGKKQKINSIEVIETHQKSIDTILEDIKIEETRTDSIDQKVIKDSKPEITEQLILDGMMIIQTGDIDVEPAKLDDIEIDSLEIETPPFCPGPEDEIVIGFINISHPPEFSDTPKTIAKSEKKKYFSKRVTEFVGENFKLDHGDLGFKGKQRINTQFTIDKKGNVSDIKIRAPHPQLEKEARRVINLLPKFRPGQQREKNVDVVYTLPIVFVIED